mmetsp:Transcript_19804/g.14235  ORF Transcript_19804/g.14235 Transcript_19804/m.14235 type:complete len:145 (-) Transcript_19804:56-490(-)
MLAKVAAAACLVASASAFAPASVPALRSTGASSMSMQMERRDAVTIGAAAAAVVPFLGAQEAEALPQGATALPKTKVFMRANFYAPEVTVFDHRGCSRLPAEYKGGKTGDQDDEMLVKVASKKVFFPEAEAAKVLAATLSTLKK